VVPDDAPADPEPAHRALWTALAGGLWRLLPLIDLSLDSLYNPRIMDLQASPKTAPSAQPKVTVVVPTYNEADNIRAMVEALLALDVHNLTVLVVDDASPDGTGEIVDRLSDEHPGRVQVLHRTGERGLGRAYIAGFQSALADGAEFIVQMDADFSHSPSYIPIFLSKMSDYDVVVGSRYVPGGDLDERWSWGRRFLSWWAVVYGRVILGLQVRDVTAGFKCWRRQVLESIGLSVIHSGGYIFQVEMAYLAENLGFRVLEVPIFFEDRRIGRSKMSMPVKLEAAWRVWEIRWRYRRLASRPRPGACASPEEAN
jgi:dolichol-phosphate mannosyltransferase